mgnify:CR=1 FL=1
MGNKQKLTRVLGVAALAMAIQGCFDNTGDGASPEVVATTSTALFDFAPKDAEGNDLNPADFLPFPNDPAGFKGSVDGSLNLPDQPNSVPVGTEPDKFNPGFIALNTVDGFSTTATMVVRFDGPVDAKTLRTGLRIFELDAKNPGPHFTSSPPLPPLGAVERELIFGIDYVASVSQGTSVLILPLKPLKEDRTYVIAVTDSVRVDSPEPGEQGDPVQRSPAYTLLQGTPANETLPPFPRGVPIALNATGDGPCDVGADTSSCIPNPAPSIEPAHEGELETAVLLETLRQITRTHLELIRDFDGATDVAEASANIVLTYSVSTQNIQAALDSAFAQAATPTLAVSQLPISSPAGAANVYAGTLSGMTRFMDLGDPTHGKWQAAPVGVCPLATDNLVACNGHTPLSLGNDLTVPVLVTAPVEEIMPLCPAELPILIYQHGITSNRGTLLALADRLAGACIVGVAIDLPKHGITSTAMLGDTPLGALSLNGLERLVQTDENGAGCFQTEAAIPYADETGFHCSSGDNFVNLIDLANARDTIRQGALDMHSLRLALATGVLDSAALGLTKGTDTDSIHFAGISLGGIVGAPFVAREDAADLSTATLNVMGGGIAKLLDGSPTFEPNITAGLFANAEIGKPSGEYEGFLIIAQTVIDSVDPVNYTDVFDQAMPILIQQVVGDPSNNFECVLNGVGCPDQVVPANLFGGTFAPAGSLDQDGDPLGWGLGQSWGVVSGTGQTTFLANQNFISTPSVLAGTDPFAQGTGFVLVSGAVQQGAIDESTAQAIGPTGAPFSPIPGGAGVFLGMNALELGAADTSTAVTRRSLIRYTDGSHGSLLDPTIATVNELMQNQLIKFISSNGAEVVSDPNAGTDDQVVRLP